MKKRHLNAVVMGVGALGRHHARVFAQHPEINLVAVVDTDEQARSACAEQWKCQGAVSLDDIKEPIDLASVAVPTSQHFAIASKLIERGIPVLVEKPIALTEEEGEQLVDLAEKHSAALQVGHIERFNPAVVELGNHLVNPLFIESHRLGPPAPRVKDVGVVLDLMIHDLDLILTLVKSDIHSIDAVGVPIITPKEDIANARLRFESGGVANVTVSRVTPEKQRKIRFFQRDTYLSVDFLKPELQIYRKIEGPSGAVSIQHDCPQLIEKEPLAAEIEAFVQCVQEGTSPVVTGQDGVRALRLARQITSQVRQVTGELFGEYER